MEAYIRAIRSEVNQTVKLAVREALEKHSNTTSAPLTPTTLSAAHSSSANQAFNNNNNNNREKNSSSSNVSLIYFKCFYVTQERYEFLYSWENSTTIVQVISKILDPSTVLSLRLCVWWEPWDACSEGWFSLSPTAEEGQNILSLNAQLFLSTQ